MKMINIAGASDGRIAPYIAESRRESDGQCLIVVPTLNRARRLQSDLSFFNGEEPVFILPPDEDSAMAYEAKSNDSLLERMRVLKALTNGGKCTVIAPVTGAIRRIPPKEVFTENTLELALGEDLDISGLRSKLSLLGYERATMVEARGEYSIRGGIIDIFTPEGEDPYRIELFDTEIDSIRSFDIDSQRSIENLEHLTVFPCSQITRDEKIFAKASGRIQRAYDRAIKRAKGKNSADDEHSINRAAELEKRRDQLLEYAEGMINLQYLERFLGYFYDETAYIWDYMDRPQLMVDDPSRILETLEASIKERNYEIESILESGRGIKEDFAALYDEDDFFRIYRLAEERDLECTIFTPFVMTIRGSKDSAEGPALTELKQVETRQMPQYDGHMDQLRADLEGYIARGFDVRIVCSTDDRMKNMLEFVQHEDFNERILPGRYEAGHVSVENGVLTAGMELTDQKLCYIWEGDIFGGSRKTKRRSKSARGGNPIKSFADVQKGDYVVHESHGIGKFTGIEQLIVQGIKQDFLKVEYAGTDMLYIPVDQLDSLQKYIGGEGISPKLNKLSGNEWKATKARAQAAVSDLANELIRVANVRRNTGGYAFAEDTVWQKEFEDSFPYTETDDQLRCISEIKEDMERPYPMDRLLCGDVGFGKTEVAARALFKCVIEGKQAAVLVPTTLLANQHYYTLKERFEKFPVRVEMLSRFRSAAQQKKIVRDIAHGDIDLVIGTHRILSSDMKFNDLGLLVIDEEQRFGVRHKEKIKQLRENVDVLTLSATPIPRTLHMSLSGMKDMSTIEEPPEGRYPVQTYVMEEDSFLIREAIEKELARGGQVYVLSNRVSSIRRTASAIQELVPNASIAVGHGQMKETELENIIMDFAAGEYDVLVSTTIIESGTDIPNVNTMIILDADRFGLAQLYQLRGRVGRSGRIAYTYLMYRKDKVLSEIAEKRLKAIRDFTEFGSGFKIAMRDLELRGAGNVLGREQSGHMLEIGYELYCKLLGEALHEAERAGETGESAHAEDLGSGRREAEATAVNLPIQAIIPSRYIDDEVLKLQMYKKIAMIETEEDASDLIDEFIDRFGDPPLRTQNLIRLSLIRAKAKKLGITEISQDGFKLKFSLMPDVRFGPDVIPNLVEEYGDRIRFNGGNRPFIRLTSAVRSGAAGRPASEDYTQGILKELEQFFKTAEGENGKVS
ncbi:MAG: transcription-repair coupling factor [Firmicutes bacterium]|nr:transcription-repair coupling factor [Bacillota bacterium]